MTANPHNVKVGQVWADCDWRATTRNVTVLVVDLDRGKAQIDRGHLKTWIRLDRFRPTSTGYRLVKDVTP